MTDNEADRNPLASQGYGATLWTPDPVTIEFARITTFIRWLAGHVTDLDLPDESADSSGPDSAAAAYQRLWQWSVDQPG